MHLNISFLLENLTLEEKAGLCSGENFWWTKSVERLGLPAVMVSDGPHGLRKQAQESDHLGLNDSVEAVCFPAGSALASSFDRNLIKQLGEHLGDEARAENLHTVLGPAINIKRSPLCGRNFEYLSEDPYLAGEMSSSYVKGVQSKQVGVSVKHYAANNQEYRRMSTDTVVSERALREIYLSAFEKTVKESKPWSLMCAYNRLNGEYCCEHEWLLNQVLRKEWGFDGIVMTDWGAMNNRTKALKAGLNLEMPSSNGYNDKKLIAAVQSGELSMEDLDKSVEELLLWIDRGIQTDAQAPKYNKEAHHDFARVAAEECAVLLKNKNNILPITKGDKVVFIGSFAALPRFQGGGSSHINSFRASSAVEAAKDISGISYSPGWKADGETSDASMLEDAVTAAKTAKVAVIFAGLPDSFESEGYDRKHLDMPTCQNELIKAVCAVQPSTVVVLHKGSPVTMPWVDDVAAVLDMYLGGQAVGEAAVNLLFGVTSPSGRLAETFPQRLQDTPCYTSFPGTGKKVVYSEGVFVGYRWYDTCETDVLFPFGHGLSYTQFEIGNLILSAKEYDGNGVLEATVEVKNIGSRAGKHVVQLYVSPPKAAAERPVHELKGFTKIELMPGESKEIKFTLDNRSFSYFEESIKDWYMECGEYTIQVGNSCRDLPLSAKVRIIGDPLPFVYNDFTTIADVVEAGKTDAIMPLLEKVRAFFGVGAETAGSDVALNDGMLDALIEGLPIHSIASFIPLPDGFIDEIISRLEQTAV